jgi:hypothetical protein
VGKSKEYVRFCTQCREIVILDLRKPAVSTLARVLGAISLFPKERANHQISDPIASIDPKFCGFHCCYKPY